MAIKAILENVIRNGGMALSQVAERIDEMYVVGRLSAEERAELTALMHERARPEAEKGDANKRIDALAQAVAALEERVKALERGADVPEGEIPAWKPWDGVSAEYAQGAVVAHKGKVWKSVYAGQNVWEPGAVGVDERYWIEVV
jgi:polyhydroxyalkanoate synthesis regulator phasin